ncbi:unnamed protein product [Paramecium primaurelia]|uniref:Uncharacterized protein n=1 Tax=Paramecium primaurelia TaxID=5886 RepID=A0A8S1JR92_PARPR|nr:unnamed protein product [Paramecium primaurelia]
MDNSCTNCLNGQCQECNTKGWILNLSTLQCELIIDDNIVTDEQCDDGNIIPMDGCFQQQYECQDSCSECYLGYCLNCQPNWKLDMQFNMCFPICGDGLIVGYEVCEDSNSSIYDGCYQCQLQCDKNCQICDQSVCQVCLLGFNLINNHCVEVCGDGIIVDQEECDDQINLIDQICNQCKYTCNIGCKLCVFGVCELCEEGYLLQDFQCQSICGDKIIIGSEQCDDGNQNPYDGCHLCQFQCQQECLDCKFGKCYDCQLEYLVDNYQCIDLCGNEAISKNEQCDDGNLEPFDGCYNCLYSCDQNCQVCQSGYCLQCKNNQWQVNSINFTCQPFCGDQFVVGYEQYMMDVMIAILSVKILVPVVLRVNVNHVQLDGIQQINNAFQYVEIFQFLEMNNVKMVMIYNMMVVIIVNFNVKMNVHFVTMEFVKHVILKDGL